MEQANDWQAGLELFDRPAFVATAGRITYINQAAQKQMIEIGQAVGPLLLTGVEEYTAFTNGCLWLTLRVMGAARGAAVHIMDGMSVFLLDQESGGLQMIALAAQNLRRPLSNIMAATDRLFPALNQTGDPAVAQQMAWINQGLYQLLRIVGNMADAEQYQLMATPNLEQTELGAYFTELFHKVQALCEGKEVQISFTRPAQPVFAAIDRPKLERAVYNLLSNALRYTPKGGRIAARVEAVGSKAVLRIVDSGEGLAQEVRQSLFSRYRRTPTIEDGRYGIGLGLLLVRQVAAMHGGAVLIGPEVGGGTVAAISLDLKARPERQLRSPRVSVDYAGERDHCLIELSDVLPDAAFDAGRIN